MVYLTFVWVFVAVLFEIICLQWYTTHMCVCVCEVFFSSNKYFICHLWIRNRNDVCLRQFFVYCRIIFFFITHTHTQLANKVPLHFIMFVCTVKQNKMKKIKTFTNNNIISNYVTYTKCLRCLMCVSVLSAQALCTTYYLVPRVKSSI